MPEPRRLSLSVVGLSDAADVVLRTLLRTPDVSAPELSARTQLSAADVDAAIAELASAGFLQMATVPIGWVPVDPAVAIEKRIAVEQRQLADRLAVLSELRATLPALQSEFSRGRDRLQPRMEMEILAGVEAIRAWIASASASARVEVLNMQTAGSTGDIQGALTADLSMLDRGVVERTLVDASDLEIPEHVSYYEQLSAAGERVRAVSSVPARASIFDREVAILPVDATDVRRAAVVVRAHTIVDSLVFLFERLWADATPMFSESSVEARPVGRPARVLELLAAGRKDESIARSLNVGVRTVRRDIAALMATLGEKTRPATVAAAIRQGWLTADAPQSAASGSKGDGRGAACE